MPFSFVLGNCTCEITHPKVNALYNLECLPTLNVDGRNITRSRICFKITQEWEGVGHGGRVYMETNKIIKLGDEYTGGFLLSSLYLCACLEMSRIKP